MIINGKYYDDNNGPIKLIIKPFSKKEEIENFGYIFDNNIKIKKDIKDLIKINKINYN